MKLTKKELQETIFQTLGRLRISIEYNPKERSMALLDKLAKDVEKLDMDLLHAQRDLSEYNGMSSVPIEFVKGLEKPF